MKIGDTILILLAEMQLMELAFRSGKIVEVRRNWMGIFGVWIELEGEPFLDEKEWFIPIESIDYE